MNSALQFTILCGFIATSLAVVNFQQVFSSVVISVCIFHPFDTQKPVDLQTDNTFDRIYVVNQNGNITAIDTTTGQSWIFLDIRSRLKTNN